MTKPFAMEALARRIKAIIEGKGQDPGRFQPERCGKGLLTPWQTADIRIFSSITAAPNQTSPADLRRSHFGIVMRACMKTVLGVGWLLDRLLRMYASGRIRRLHAYDGERAGLSGRDQDG